MQDALKALRKLVLDSGFLEVGLATMPMLIATGILIDQLAGVEGISVTPAEEIEGLKIGVRPAPGAKCERCWTIATSVGQDRGPPEICHRCAEVVRSLDL